MNKELQEIINLKNRLTPLTDEETNKLTVRQVRKANSIINDNKKRAFAREYVRTGSVSSSSITAGYSRNNGYKLLSNKKVQKYISEITDLAGTEEIANIQESLMHLSTIIRGDVFDYAYTKDGEVFEMPVTVKDRVKALDILTKCQGLQQTNLKVDGRLENINVTVEGEPSNIIYEVNPDEVEVVDVEDLLEQ